MDALHAAVTFLWPVQLSHDDPIQYSQDITTVAKGECRSTTKNWTG